MEHSEHGDYDHEHSNNKDKWTVDIDQILDNIRHNSILLSEYHRTQYFLLQKKLKYFRIPVIVVSSFSAFFNFGLQPYLDQNAVATICSMMSLFAGLLGSLELYLQIQKKMENELMNSKDYYLNAIDIYKVIRLERKNRNGDGKTYLEERYNIYRKLIEGSSLLIENSDLSDFLTPKQNATIKRKTNDKIIDKFKLYCNLVENTDLNNTNIMNKLVPILINPTKNNDSINFQDKLELFCNLYDKIPENNRELLEKLKPFILNNTQDTNDDTIKDRFLIYSDLMQYKDFISKDSLEKVKTLLLDEIKVNFNDDIQFDYINHMLKNNNKNNNNINSNIPIFNKLQQITPNSFLKLNPLTSIHRSSSGQNSSVSTPKTHSESNFTKFKENDVFVPESIPTEPILGNESRKHSESLEKRSFSDRSDSAHFNTNYTYNLDVDIENNGEDTYESLFFRKEPFELQMSPDQTHQINITEPATNGNI